jgi:hypothetical protein
MKYTLCTIFVFAIAQMCYGQNEHLEPADLQKHAGSVKTYYNNVFPLLYKHFANKPVARYTSMPSFDYERSFSAEKKDDGYFIISDWLSDSYWYAKDKKRVKVRTGSTEIDEELYKTIGELFQLLAKQTRKPETDEMGNDGTIYYFASTGNNGEINIGEAWSPRENTLLGRLVNICDNLYLIGKGNDINQSEIQAEITRLIADLEK